MITNSARTIEDYAEPVEGGSDAISLSVPTPDAWRRALREGESLEVLQLHKRAFLKVAHGDLRWMENLAISEAILRVRNIDLRLP